MSKGNWAYLVRCSDGSFYAGWTTHLQNRIDTHNAGKGAKYTKGRRPVTLVWAQNHESRSLAMQQEAQLKKLSRQEKARLAAEYKP